MTDFTIYLESQGYANRTRKVYLAMVKRFCHWYKKDSINAETKDILKYLSYLQNNLEMQNGSRKGHLNALKKYFSYIGKSEITAYIQITSSKKERLNHIFSSQELEQICDEYYAVFIQDKQFDSSLLCYFRNYTMLGLIVFQGLRTTELDALQTDDVNLQKATITIKPHGRQGKRRTLKLQACQIGNLMHYLQIIRPQLAPQYDASNKLLLPLTEKKYRGNNEKLSIAVSLAHLHRQLKEIRKEYTNLKQLRNSAITHWIKNHGLRKAQYMAGHKSIVSTEEYLKNDLEALSNDLEKYHPL